MSRDYKEEENALFLKIIGLRDSEVAHAYAKLLNMRYEKQKEALVTNNDDMVRGQAKELRELLTKLKLRGD